MDLFVDIHSGKVFYMRMDSECGLTMRHHGIYEYNLIRWCEQYCSPTSTFLDIGAHIGTYSVLLSPFCKEVHAFEPQKHIYECLVKSIEVNGLSNVITHNVAVGQTEGTSILNRISVDGGMSTVRNDIHSEGRIIEKEEVKVVKLDNYDLKNVDFIKIDVEGLELDVIKGGLMTLEKNNYPPIMFEAWPDKSYEKDREELIAFAKAIGYSVYPISGTNNMYLASDHPRRKAVRKVVNLAQDLEKIVLSAFYDGKLEEGRRACEELILLNGVDWETHNRCLLNIQFYMSKLDLKKQIKLTPKLPRCYVATTPSIVSDGNKFLINVRAVNYFMENGGYFSRHNDGVIRTMNYLLKYDENLEKYGDEKTLSGIGDATLFPGNISGLEDVRLFTPNDFTCTSLEIIESHIPQICWGTFDEFGNVSKLRHLVVPGEPKCEKNWLPFVRNGEKYVLYSTSPFCIYKITEDGLIKHFEGSIKDKNIEDFRGSACPIPFTYEGVSGMLYTIHQVYHAKMRNYYHRFVWVDDSYSTLKFSDLFIFEHVGIEFNLNLAMTQDGLALSYSVKDSTSYIGILDVDKIVLSHTVNISPLQ